MKGYNGDVVGMWCGLLLALAFQMSYYVIGDLMGTIEVVLDSTTKRMGLNHDTNIVLHHQTKIPMKHIGLNQKTSHHFPSFSYVFFNPGRGPTPPSGLRRTARFAAAPGSPVDQKQHRPQRGVRGGDVPKVEWHVETWCGSRSSRSRSGEKWEVKLAEYSWVLLRSKRSKRNGKLGYWRSGMKNRRWIWRLACSEVWTHTQMIV